MAFRTASLEQLLTTHPDYQQQWTPQPQGGLKNPKFGEVEPVVICKEDGTPLFDQYWIKEQPGAIILPYEIRYFEKGTTMLVRVGLITQERPIPGGLFIEVPRGFGHPEETALKTAYRELLEETGLASGEGSIQLLGRINPNPSFYKTDIPLLAVCFDEIKAIANPGGDKIIEKIQKVAPYTFRNLRQLQGEGRLKCGLTKAALFEFGCFLPQFYNPS